MLLPTTLLAKTCWPWCSPSPPPHPKSCQTWWGHGGHRRKKIGGQLGLVRIYLTLRPNKTHNNSLHNSPFWKQACPSAAWRIIVNKKEHVNIHLKITLPCCRDNAPLNNIERSHSPINLKSGCHSWPRQNTKVISLPCIWGNCPKHKLDRKAFGDDIIGWKRHGRQKLGCKHQKPSWGLG